MARLYKGKILFSKQVQWSREVSIEHAAATPIYGHIHAHYVESTLWMCPWMCIEHYYWEICDKHKKINNILNGTFSVHFYCTFSFDEDLHYRLYLTVSKLHFAIIFRSSIVKDTACNCLSLYEELNIIFAAHARNENQLISSPLGFFSQKSKCQ